MVGIEEVAQRNQLVLYHASRPGQWKAHCPICKDRGRSFHLYVNSDRDVYMCQKCGASGGAIQFHAWLRDISFEAAKEELYPRPMDATTRRPVKLHPAEQLTKQQLAQIGFTMRTPRKITPSGVDPAFWAKRRRAELDWIWAEWLEYQAIQRERDEFWRQLAALEQPNAAV